MAIGDRIVAFREAKNINQTELAQKTGINRSVLNRIELNTRPIRSDELAAISKVLNVTMDKLAGLSSDLPIGVYDFNDMNYIPVLGSVKCGFNAPNDEKIEEYIGISDKYRPNEMKAFIAEGDSMEGDNIFEGDICIIHLQDEVPDGAIAVCVIDGVEGTMKHVHRESGVIVLQSSNPKYPPQIFAGEDANRVRVVGELVELRRNVKK